MKKTDAVKFLNLLIEKYPNDAVPMLIDIIVDYLLFPRGDGTNPSPTTCLIVFQSDKSMKLQSRYVESV